MPAEMVVPAMSSQASGNPTVVFRTDASRSIGGGHVMRCLALADALRSEAAECSFACSRQTPASVPALVGSGYRCIELDEAADPEALSQAIPEGCDWLVVDHYGWNAAYEARCRPWARNILVIDDLANRPHDCDLLLDQTAGRAASAYSGLLPAAGDLLVGSQYALLRPEFAAARPGSLAHRKTIRLNRVLVSMGLSDPSNATETILLGIVESGLSLTVDVVLGPSAPGLPVVRSLVDRHRDAFILHVGTEAMAELMTGSDLCFGAAGSTAWERCCLGLPTVLTVIADNQREIAARLVDEGAVISLGPASELAPTDVAGMLRKLDCDPGALAELATRSAAICDGRGAQRVAMRIRPTRAAGGRPVWLRPTTPDDLEITYEWQAQPETRRFGRNNAIPSRTEHEAWFAARLKHPASLLSVIVCDGEAVGTLRLDRLDSLAYEISIVVSSSFYGRGIGLAALELARRLVPEARIKAEILAGNARSEALFTKAGYLPKGYGWRSVDPLVGNSKVCGDRGQRMQEMGRLQ
jgi:UDP-2,4-diacetamido-2,4,6-trideoxy-beta-L-altropyranose hydrolase